jgi:hypothetical protein
MSTTTVMPTLTTALIPTLGLGSDLILKQVRKSREIEIRTFIKGTNDHQAYGL